MLVNLDAARRCLRMLDPDATSFTFQTFDDQKRLVERIGRDGKLREVDPLAKVSHGSLDAVAPRLVELSQAGAGVYVCVNETDLRGRTARNVTRVRAIFADLDGAPLENLKRFGLKPSIVVVSSPGRFHAYWPVAGVDLAQFRDLQRRLARVLESDKSVIDLPRVLRLPGFEHQKGERFTVTAHYGARRVYSPEEIVAELDEVEKRLGLPPEPKTVCKAGHSTGRAGRRSLTEQLARGDDSRDADADRISDRCAGVGLFREIADVSNPLWFACMSVLSRCANGLDRAREWSPQHRQARVEAVLERCEGPATCSHFEGIDHNICAECPHRGKITSPVQLGRVIAAPTHQRDGPQKRLSAPPRRTSRALGRLFAKPRFGVQHV